jgi:hypothetical protein
MIEFHEPTIEDRAWAQPILRACGYPGAEYAFSSAYLWSGYNGRVAEVGGFFVQARDYGGETVCLYPAGTGDVKPVLDELMRDCRERGQTVCFQALTQEKKDELERLYPGRFYFAPAPATYDYIYTVGELTEMRGKKLQAKRNHCNRFISENPDWYTVPVTKDNMDLCREMQAAWQREHDEGMAVESEDVALERAFTHFEELELDGLLLSDGSRIVAFSMGTRMNETSYDVHFEKAFADVQGAYAVINREFSRMVAAKYPGLQYLNREDDMGLEGLRRAKQSYQPTILLQKFVANDQEKL